MLVDPDNEDESLRAVVHYIGDPSFAANYKHKNSKAENKAFVPTKKSTQNEIKERVKGNVPNKVYKQMVCEELGENESNPITCKPRNEKQVANARQQVLQTLRLSSDAIINIHDLAYELPTFFHHITTYPDIVLICGMKEMIEEVEHVIKIKPDDPVEFMYDTTFNMGDFYFTPLLFKHTVFKELPTMPLSFMIHERKREQDHEIFCRFIDKEIKGK